ncbi:MAG: LysR family transcriptional regulator [Nocardioides sp.]
MTPTQLRAFASVVRLGSVKAAAEELAITEAAVSIHVRHLRDEFADSLFTRTSQGLAFTPGGLRLASRAVEILGLQDRTLREVSQAGAGRRLLRVAASPLFAEHAAPGLIDLFANRAKDLEVELTVRPVADFPQLLASRSADVTIGPALRPPPASVVCRPFLTYEVTAVTAATHPLAGRAISADQARRLTWNLGPSAIQTAGVVHAMVAKLGIPEARQRIFQSEAAALAETRRTSGVALAVKFTVAGDLASGRLTTLEAPGLRDHGQWVAMALPAAHQPPAAAELLRFISTPRATQAMIRGSGVNVGRFKPTVHVTLWG